MEVPEEIKLSGIHFFAPCSTSEFILFYLLGFIFQNVDSISQNPVD
jgi:hypothetical protein